MSKEKGTSKGKDKKKERQDKYEKPLVINGTFDELMGLIVEGNPKPKRGKEKE